MQYLSTILNTCENNLILPLQEMNDTIYLLLGGNTGDRLSYLEAALQQINTRCGKIISQSRYYETAAWGQEDLQPFLNIAIGIETARSPEELLQEIHLIEQEYGRERIVKWGARTLDIDIIFYGDKIVDTPFLQIPHPLMQERRFVLMPLQEIAADFVHPVFQKTVAGLLADCKDELPAIAVG